MSDTGKQGKGETHQRIRSDFDALSPQEKVAFLAEAASSTVVQGAQQFGSALSREIKDFTAKRSASSQGDGPAAEDDEDISVGDAAATVVRSLQQFGQVLSHEIEDMFWKRSGSYDPAWEEASDEGTEEAEEAGDAAAEADDKKS